MIEPARPTRQRYQEWIREQVEAHKAGLPRDELLQLADDAIRELFQTPDGQCALTELVLCDAVDALIIRRLRLPGFRSWARTCQDDTVDRPLGRSPDGGEWPAD
jgi:hypothetical protein